MILEGTDTWRTYAELELLIALPLTGHAATLNRAAHLQCFYFDQQVTGPVSLLVIFHKIRMGKLPPDVQSARSALSMETRVRWSDCRPAFASTALACDHAAAASRLPRNAVLSSGNIISLKETP